MLHDQANSLAVDASGNVYVTGESIGSGDRAMTTPPSSTTQGGLSSGWQDITARAMVLIGAWDLAVDALGNVYVTGGSTGLGTSQDYATIKYNAAGTNLWVVRYNGPPSGLDSRI